MLIKLETFIVDGGIPTINDITEAINICKEKNCIVKIMWLPNAYAGWHDTIVTIDSIAQDVYDRLPKVYGL